MRNRTIRLDDKSDEALRTAAHYLGYSVSEVVRRMAMHADAAVFWGVQLHLGKGLPADELAALAKKGCTEFGLFTLSSWGDTREGIGALRLVAKDQPPPKDEA